MSDKLRPDAWGLFCSAIQSLPLTPGDAMASLFILKGVDAGQHFSLEQDVLIIGRSPDCDLVLPATSVSRQHARLLLVQDQWFVEDMKSRNGTNVNGQPIKVRTPLRHNDRVRICDFLAAFHDSPQATMPPELIPQSGEGDGSTNHDTSSSHTSKVLADQSTENLRNILAFSNSLVKTLELDQLLPRIVDGVFQSFKQAERCFLVLDDGHGNRNAKAVRTRTTEDAASARFSTSVVKDCLDKGEALLTRDAALDPRTEGTESVLTPGLRSIMCVPLTTADDKAVGAIQLDTRDRQRFTEDDLKLLWGMANQAIIALENARLHESLLEREQYERDLEVAGHVQRCLLPESLPELAGYEFFAHYAAALTVGGDYYDFIPLPQRRLAVLLGDVAGKGVSAALLMARLSAEMRACLMVEEEPAAAIARLNESLYPHTQRTHRFVTLTAAVLDLDRQEVTLVNAGHLPPLLYRRSTDQFTEALPRALSGTVLGMDRGLTFESYRVPLQPGDCLLLFTDGVCEAVHVHDQNKLLEGVHTTLQDGGPYCPRTLGERLQKTAEQEVARNGQQDDITLVCFGRMS